jgi:hypothetical protein
VARIRGGADRRPWSASSLVCANPTIRPLALIASAEACRPPSVPMSVITSFWNFHARSMLAALSPLPTTSP